LIVQLNGEGELIVLIIDAELTTVAAIAERFKVSTNRTSDNRAAVAVAVDAVTVRVMSLPQTADYWAQQGEVKELPEGP
jgi:hypothetical protein